MEPARGRIGIFGGTFDPVHTAHLEVAEAVRGALGLDRMLLVVANEPWQKRDQRSLTPAEDRFAMVEAAVEGWPGLVACRMEIDRGGPSYTIDTVRQLRKEHPAASLILVVGSDVVAGLTTWQDEPSLRGPVTLAVVGRPGVPGGRAAARMACRERARGPVRPVQHRVAGPARVRSVGGGDGARGGDPLHRATGSVRYEEMTVGTSPTESGTTTPSSGPSNQAVGAESRRALRAHRRQRRRIAIGCAVFITVCVVITLVIVDIARDRTSTPQSAGPSPEGVVVHVDRSFIALAPSTDIPGALAPVGGHR